VALIKNAGTEPESIGATNVSSGGGGRGLSHLYRYQRSAAHGPLRARAELHQKASGN
jgi:hypothetical protein